MSGSENRKRSLSRASAQSENLSLGSTVDLFADRLQRKLKKQEQVQDCSRKEAEQRHARILQAMTTIRKAIQDTCKIRLGDRFYFQVNVSDFEGWPKVELNLVDSVVPSRKDYGLLIAAHDRNDSGTVYFATLNNRLLGKVELQNQEEFNRIPLLLKKTVRSFLDTVADYVLNPPEPHELLEIQTRAIDLEEEPDGVKEHLSDADLFSEELNISDQNRVEMDESEGELVADAAIDLDRIDNENRLEELDATNPLTALLD